MSLSALNGEMNPSLSDLASLSRMADFMTRYVVRKKFPPPIYSGSKTPEGEPIIARRLETATDRMLEKRNLHTDINGEIGDFSMFVYGMFPEFVRRRRLTTLYTGTGSAAYWQEFRRATSDHFFKLATDFEFYAGVITDARDRFMAEVSEDGSVKIVTVPEKIRYRAVGSTVLIDNPNPYDPKKAN